MPLLQSRLIVPLLRMVGGLLIALLFSATGLAAAQCTSAGGDCCDPSDCCTNSCDYQADGICDQSSYGGPCGSDGDCTGGMVCISGQCGCSDPCDDPTCPGNSCDACGTNCNGTCQTDSDCSGGLECMGGTCGCSDPCDDPSCSGYSCDACGGCDCSSPCDDPSCSGYDVCTCEGTCASSSCPGYNPCTCE